MAEGEREGDGLLAEVSSKRSARVIGLVATGFAALYWVLVSLLDTILLAEGGFWTNLLSPPPREVLTRGTAVLILLACTLLFQHFYTTRVRAERALTKRLRIEEFVEALSTRFINVSGENLDDDITTGLQALGEFLSIDRCSLVQLDESATVVESVHEWYAPGLQPRSEAMGALDFRPFTWGRGRLRAMQPIIFENPADLPPEAANERRTYEALGIRSFMAMPLTVLDRPRGYLAFQAEREARKWDERDVTLLKLAGAVFASLASRTRTEAALRESQELMASLYKTVPTGIALTDEEGLFQHVNDAYCSIYGFGRDELLGRPFTLVMPPGEEAPALAAYRRLLSGDMSVGTVRKRRRKSGEIVFIEAWNSLLLRGDGRRLVVTVVNDITARRAVEEALRRSEERYQGVYSKSPVAFVLWDQEHKIFDWNRRSEELFGWTREEVLGRDYLELLVPAESAGQARAAAARLFEGGPTSVDVNLNVTKSGRQVWCEWVHAVLHDREGHVEGAISLALDVTARKNAEQRLLASLAEKEVLLKELHHRVKNNLQVIWTLLDLQAAGLPPGEATRALRESQGRISSIALVHEKFYRSQDMSKIELAAYLRDLVAHLFSAYGVGPDRVRTDMDVIEVPLSLDVAIPLGLIVHELVSNSLKYAFPGERRGSLAVSLRRNGDAMLSLSVEDDGEGFPPEDGVGARDSLGLKLVATLAHQIGGTVRKSVGPRASISVTFPEKHESR